MQLVFNRARGDDDSSHELDPRPRKMIDSGSARRRIVSDA